MRNRMLALVGSLVLAAAAALSLGAQPLAAQAGKAAPKTPTVPRTADGHPDLQGFYDVATMTPVERLPGVNNLVLTKEEAAALEQYEAQRQVKNDAPRTAPAPPPPL